MQLFERTSISASANNPRDTLNALPKEAHVFLLKKNQIVPT